MADQKIVYRYDSNNLFTSTDLVGADYQLKPGETFLAVPQGALEPIKWTGSAWQSATQEEHDAYVKQQQALYPQQQPSNEPTTQDKLNANTTVQLAQLVDKSKQQDQLNAQLTIDVATLKQALQKQDTKTTATTATTAQAQA